MKNSNHLLILISVLAFACTKSEKTKEINSYNSNFWVENYNTGNYPSKTFHDDKVYCSSIELRSGLPNYLFSLNLLNGKVDWKSEVDSWANFAPVVLDSSIYYCSYLGHIYSFTKQGKVNWKNKVDGSYAGHRLNPTNNNLYVATVEDGVQEFDYKTGRLINHIGKHTLSVTLPVLNDKLICYGNLSSNTSIIGNQLVCFQKRTLDTIWSKTFPDIEKLYKNGDKIYFINNKKSLNCLSLLTGDLIWSKNITENYFHGIYIKNNILILYSDDLLLFFDIHTGVEINSKLTYQTNRYALNKDDSTHYKIYCEIGNFKGNDDFENSCNLIVEKVRH